MVNDTEVLVAFVVLYFALGGMFLVMLGGFTMDGIRPPMKAQFARINGRRRGGRN